MSRPLWFLVSVGVILLTARPARGQQAHESHAGGSVRVAAHAIGLATHATPALLGEDKTEAYLTQPAVMMHAARGPLTFTGMVNLEGLTLERGELNAGVWGEGYVDRRHPHTYLHEAVLSYRPVTRGTSVSVSAGRGFAPFGTDDPMVRGFVKYPTNHHLSQILERLIVVGAVRRGPVLVEAGVFNGDEPLSSGDFGRVDRVGDSWSVRATLVPAGWLEVQASYADVTSPEQPFGGGLDHRMWNASGRFSRVTGRNSLSALVEAGRTGEFSGEIEAFHFYTVLAEAALRLDAWRAGARFESSDRPEEERTTDLFRSVRPATDNSILGTTRWTSYSVQVSRTFALGVLRAEPLVEISHLHARANQHPAVIEPDDLYGSANLWSLSFGIRTTFGRWHSRMGHYGAAESPEQTLN
jgi:hypothetical protein